MNCARCDEPILRGEAYETDYVETGSLVSAPVVRHTECPRDAVPRVSRLRRDLELRRQRVIRAQRARVAAERRRIPR